MRTNTTTHLTQRTIVDYMLLSTAGDIKKVIVSWNLIESYQCGTLQHNTLNKRLPRGPCHRLWPLPHAVAERNHKACNQPSRSRLPTDKKEAHHIHLRIRLPKQRFIMRPQTQKGDVQDLRRPKTLAASALTFASEALAHTQHQRGSALVIHVRCSDPGCVPY